MTAIVAENLRKRYKCGGLRRPLRAIGAYMGLLLGLTAVTSAFATWTFRAYQRSL